MTSEPIVVPDTNAYLHNKMFTDCDWPALVGEKSVRIAVPQVVLKELDEKKYSAESASTRQRAQDCLKHLEEAAHKGQLGNGTPVDFLPLLSEPEWDALHLNPKNPDHRTIAEVLELQKRSGARVVLVTNDLGMRLNARSHGIEVATPPDEWRREAKDPRERELNTLKQQVKRFQDREPACKLFMAQTMTERLDVPPPPPSPFVALDEKAIAQRVADERRERWIGRPSRSHPLLAYDMMAPSASEYDRYEKELEEYLGAYEQHLRIRDAWSRLRTEVVRVEPVLVNEGSGTAEDIDIFIELPEDVEFVPPEVIDEEPEAPEPPDEPRRGMDFSYLTRQVNRLPPLHVPRNTDNDPRGPTYSEDAREVSYWYPSLKHGLTWSAPAFYVRPREPRRSFSMTYTVHDRHTIDPPTGKLAVVFVPVRAEKEQTG